LRLVVILNVFAPILWAGAAIDCSPTGYHFVFLGLSPEEHHGLVCPRFCTPFPRTLCAAVRTRLASKAFSDLMDPLFVFFFLANLCPRICRQFPPLGQPFCVSKGPLFPFCLFLLIPRSSKQRGPNPPSGPWSAHLGLSSFICHPCFFCYVLLSEFPRGGFVKFFFIKIFFFPRLQQYPLSFFFPLLTLRANRPSSCHDFQQK